MLVFVEERGSETGAAWVMLSAINSVAGFILGIKGGHLLITELGVYELISPSSPRPWEMNCLWANQTCHPTASQMLHHLPS